MLCTVPPALDNREVKLHWSLCARPAPIRTAESSSTMQTKTRSTSTAFKMFEATYMATPSPTSRVCVYILISPRETLYLNHESHRSQFHCCLRDIPSITKQSCSQQALRPQLHSGPHARPPLTGSKANKKIKSAACKLGAPRFRCRDMPAGNAVWGVRSSDSRSLSRSKRWG